MHCAIQDCALFQAGINPCSLFTERDVRLDAFSMWEEGSLTIFERAILVLQQAQRIVFFTGAGVSAESGIPTYQDQMPGIWAQNDARELETEKAFRANPALVWGWYIWRRQRVAQAQPNAAHLAIAHMPTQGYQVDVVTQNIDDLHERAGSLNVIHLHGALSIPKCSACHRPGSPPVPPTCLSGQQWLLEPPRCHRCNGKMRPDVVWYGEGLPIRVWKEAVSLVRECDVLVSIGASGRVMPAASLSAMALAAGGSIIHINTVDVCLEHPDALMLMGRATEILPSLISNLRK